MKWIRLTVIDTQKFPSGQMIKIEDRLYLIKRRDFKRDTLWVIPYITK